MKSQTTQLKADAEHADTGVSRKLLSLGAA